MTALELDSRMEPEDNTADAEVAALGLESESEALAFAEQVQPLRVLRIETRELHQCQRFHYQ